MTGTTQVSKNCLYYIRNLDTITLRKKKPQKTLE